MFSSRILPRKKLLLRRMLGNHVCIAPSIHTLLKNCFSLWSCFASDLGCIRTRKGLIVPGRSIIVFQSTNEKKNTTWNRLLCELVSLSSEICAFSSGICSFDKCGRQEKQISDFLLYCSQSEQRICQDLDRIFSSIQIVVIRIITRVQLDNYYMEVNNNRLNKSATNLPLATDPVKSAI
jgi:hypothetical protein